MRSRLRKLHIDGREFTWKADIGSAPRPGGRGLRHIRVRVWGAGKNGRALQADLVERPGSTTRSDPETYPYPVADDVTTMIRYALTAGWTPETLGGTFRLTSAATLALPNFLITDLP